MVSQNLHDFDLLTQSLSPLSSFACKAKLARFCDPAVNISCGTGSKEIMSENKHISPASVSLPEARGGIYLHIPFCNHRCGYCAFYTAGARLADWKLFEQGVAGELASRASELSFQPETLYFGGGTPSLLPPQEFLSLVGILEREGRFRREELREFTIEVNPDDVDESRADAWLEGGVNRISMGVQSFDAGELRLLGRRHDPAHISRSLEILRKRFSNISIDLIYSLPGQTPEAWERNLRKAVEADLPHISLYSLSFEERSALTYRLGQNELEVPDEDFGAEMNRLNDVILSEGSLYRYETSNYARRGYESLHNGRYWSGAPYLGLGPSASSYDGGRRRRTNASDLRGYLRGNVDYEAEELTDEELLEEYLMTRLRRAEGISLLDFESRFGAPAREKLLRQTRRFIGEGLLSLNESRLQPTSEGLYMLDYILVELISS